MEKDEHIQDFEKINQLWLNERTDKEDLKNKGKDSVELTDIKPFYLLGKDNVVFC